MAAPLRTRWKTTIAAVSLSMNPERVCMKFSFSEEQEAFRE